MADNLNDDIVEHLDWIQSTINQVDTSSQQVQKELLAMLQQQIARFEIKDGRFIASQDLRRRMVIIEQQFENILTGKLYTNAIKDYLGTFSTIAEVNATLHQNYNDLQVKASLLEPARRVVYEQAREAMYGSGIDSQFKEPVKHLLLQKVTTGASISDMEKILDRWTTGDLSGRQDTFGKPLPNLSQYNSQVARDTSYQFNGTVNQIIKEEYGLDGIKYVGGTVRDSRPLCVHLVNLRRDISNEELAKLLEDPNMKPGRIPGTTVENFCTYRGGYNCIHGAFPIRMRGK